MLLTVDIGNSSLKAAIFNKDEIVHHYKENELSTFISEIKRHPIKNAAICSVVPELVERTSAKIKEAFNITPFILTKDVQFNLEIKYKTPETLGIDRICSLEGAYHFNKHTIEKGTYLLTIDFGTATTINILNYPNCFIGGLIAPGINTMFNTLNTSTSQLPMSSLENYLSIIGDNTASSIASGIVNSAIGLIEKTIGYISSLDEFKKIIIYATGGMSEPLKEYLPQDVILDKFLVHRGIKSVYELNNK